MRTFVLKSSRVTGFLITLSDLLEFRLLAMLQKDFSRLRFRQIRAEVLLIKKVGDICIQFKNVLAKSVIALKVHPLKSECLLEYFLSKSV